LIVDLAGSERIDKSGKTSHHISNCKISWSLDIVKRVHLSILPFYLFISGSEGHMIEEAKFINLSLTSLGKCINALAENSPHIPTRDSKLTRILRDSFGGAYNLLMFFQCSLITSF
jgi:hypothetical protein